MIPTLPGVSFNIHSHIFSFLTHSEICRLGWTCKSLHKSSELDHVWTVGRGATGRDRKKHFLTSQMVFKNLEKGRMQSYTLEGHVDNVTNIEIDGDMVLSTSKDGTVKEWNLRTNKGKTYQGHINWTLKAFYWEDGIVSASADKTVRVWSDPDTSKVIRGHNRPITNAKMVGTRRIVTGSFDETVRIWDLRRGKQIKKFTDHTGMISLIEFASPYLVTVSHPQNVINIRDLNADALVYSLSMGAAVYGTRNGGDRPSSLLFDPDAGSLITGENGWIRLWDLREKLSNPCQDFEITGVPQGINNRKAKSVTGLRSLDEHRLIASCEGVPGIVRFDVRKISSIQCYEDHFFPPIKIDMGKGILSKYFFSSGGTQSNQYNICAYSKSAPRERIVNFIPGHKSSIVQMAVSDDKIITGSLDGDLKVISLLKPPSDIKRNRDIRILSKTRNTN